MPQILATPSSTYAYTLSTTANDAHAVVLPPYVARVTLKPTTNACRLSFSDTDDSAMAANDYPLSPDVATELKVNPGGIGDKRGAMQVHIASVTGLSGKFAWIKIGSTESCIEFDGVGANINVAVGDAATTASNLATAVNTAAINGKMAQNQLDTTKVDLVTTSEKTLAFRTDAPTLVEAEMWQPGERSVIYIGSATHSTVVRIVAEVR